MPRPWPRYGPAMPDLPTGIEVLQPVSRGGSRATMSSNAIMHRDRADRAHGAEACPPTALSRTPSMTAPRQTAYASIPLHRAHRERS
jgi:hypothetical protein